MPARKKAVSTTSITSATGTTVNNDTSIKKTSNAVEVDKEIKKGRKKSANTKVGKSRIDDNSNSSSRKTPSSQSSVSTSSDNNAKNIKGSKKGKSKVSVNKDKKKNKLSYSGTDDMDIMAEFSQRNRDIIVKFPMTCVDSSGNTADGSNHIPIGNALEYNPNIIDPLPMIDLSQNNIIGQSISSNNLDVESSDTDNVSDAITQLKNIQDKIYNEYITAGSNTHINLQNLLNADKSLLVQYSNLIDGNGIKSISGSNGTLLSTPISKCMNNLPDISPNNPKLSSENNDTSYVANIPLSSSCNTYNTSTVNDLQHNLYNQQSIANIEGNAMNNISRYQKKIDDLLTEFAAPDKKRDMTQIEILLHKKYNQTKQIELMYSMCQYVNTTEQWPKSCTCACLWDSHEFTHMPWGIPESYDIETKKFSLSGVFCSPNCALAYLIQEERNTGAMWEKISLLNLLYHKVYQGTSLLKSSAHTNDGNNINKTSEYIDSIESELKAIDEISGLTQLEKRNRKKMIKHRAKVSDQSIHTKWGTENLVPAPDKITLRKFGGPLTIEQFRCLTINNDKQYKIVFPPCAFVAPVLEETKKVFMQESNFTPIDKNYITRIEKELKMKRTMPVGAPKIRNNRSSPVSSRVMTSRMLAHSMPASAASR